MLYPGRLKNCLIILDKRLDVSVIITQNIFSVTRLTGLSLIWAILLS